MDLVAVILFLVLYYIRPQEWTGAFATIHFVQIVMLTALGSLYFRARSVRLADLFRTPHDWAVLAFWLWLVFTSPTRWDTFRESANLYIFYIVIVQTLYNVPRLNTFVGWWTFLICTVAALALLSLYGFDPLGGLEIVNGSMKGRLILNLSIFNNPNALGHSVVPAIPLLYYVCIWKKPIILRALGFALIAMVGYCIFLTVSKGAFLSGAVTMVATLAFGRPKLVQAAIVGAALIFGGTALSMLPRMGELNKSKTDEAIQGRIMAFKHGYKMMTTTNSGVGYHNWGQSFLAGKYTFKRTKIDKDSLKRPMPIIYKAPHSSYVCIGAELGYTGFFLHFGILYCCLRTLMTARTETPDEERVRRVLFVLIVSYVVSSWMVDFEYRPTFFMFAAAAAALHRHLHGVNEAGERRRKKDAEESPEATVASWRAQLRPQPALEGLSPEMTASTAVLTMEPLASENPQPEQEIRTISRIGFAWNRIGWIDLTIIWAMTYFATRYWSYLITRI